MSTALQDLSKTYENIMLLGDFNMTPVNVNLDLFLDTFNLENLVKEPTCFKGEIPSCIELTVTNQKNLFSNTKTFITGISDFHSLVVSSLKQTFSK